MMENICLNTDSYKVTHHYFYPKNTQRIYSYMESRTGAEFNKTVFYGLQYVLKKHLAGCVVTEDKVFEAEKIIREHIGENVFNLDDWLYIANELDGKLPVEIKAVAEGTPVDVGNVLISIENTDERCFWLPNYLEPLLLQVWYPSTVATLSAEVKRLFNFYLKVTGCDVNNAENMLQDCGFRGTTCLEASMIGGSAHLLNFTKTATVPSLLIPQQYYNEDKVCAYAIQATEHSVMTSLSKEGEISQAINVIKSSKGGTLAIVIDSYNYRNFLEQAIGVNTEFNQEIRKYISNENNKILFRPDSGNPVTTVSESLNILSKGFKTYENKEGFKKFEDNIGLVWNDGLNYHTLRDVLFEMTNNGWATDNVLFGMGAGLHTSINRDTQRNAFKCSAQYRDGTWHNVSKEPLDTTKKSKSGRFKLIKEDNVFKTVPISYEGKDYLRPVFRNGEVLIEDTFHDIRKRTLDYTQN